MAEQRDNRAKLRGWWAHRQGLDGSLMGSYPAEILQRTGWARSVGGSSPYLTLRARGGLDREAVDKAMQDLAIHELPSARGCTYILPADDFALGLRVGADAPDAELASAIKHLGVTEAEIDTLGDAVVAACKSADAPLDPRALAQAVGDAARSLGEAGKKRGVFTTLPLALGVLQAQGRIRRVPVNGRLDQQRYGYVAWTSAPDLPGDMTDADVDAALAERYFRWTGPASLAHFRWFSGLTAARAKAAMSRLDLTSVGDDGLMLLTEDLAAFRDFTPLDEPNYTLVGLFDGIHILHRDFPRLLDPEDAARPAPLGKGKTLGDLADPPAEMILHGGRLIGLWAFDPDAEKIVAWTFVPRNDALDAAITETERFVMDQLGDVRSISLDSPKSRQPLLQALRDAA
ncbi:MAG: crosslink repair DNA glycosylase YcaQ family protein [Thermomicrobiales bacterium]